MGIIEARESLKKYGLEDRIMEFDTSSATVELAALAIGCNVAEIAKTLSFIVGQDVILIVMAGNSRIDNRKYKDEFGTKARMVDLDKAEELVGHGVGGICPFGIKDGVKVYLDESLKRFKKVYPACGSSNSAVALSIEELENISNYLKWIDISKKEGIL